MTLSQDDLDVIDVLEHHKRGLRAIGVAMRLRWFRESSIREFARKPNEHRVVLAMQSLMHKGLVVETMTGSGSRYKLANRNTLRATG